MFDPGDVVVFDFSGVTGVKRRRIAVISFLDSPASPGSCQEPLMRFYDQSPAIRGQDTLGAGFSRPEKRQRSFTGIRGHP